MSEKIRNYIHRLISKLLESTLQIQMTHAAVEKIILYLSKKRGKWMQLKLVTVV